MSYRVGTTNYNLPLTEGTDKRDWSDTNQAFADIDAAIKTASDDATLATTIAQSAQTAATGAVADASSAVTTANAASATAQTASEAAALARTEAQGAVTVAGQANTTAQAAQTTASNADTVALAAQGAVGDLTQLQTTDKSSAVAAINEVLSQIGGGTMELDFANKVAISGTAITTNTSGALIGNFYAASTGSGVCSLLIDGTAMYYKSSAETGIVSVNLDGIPSGTTIAFDGSFSPTSKVHFVPYAQ